jgi:hypothetical protein
VVILWGRDTNGTMGERVGGGRGRDSGRAGAHVSRGGWVSRSAHRLVRPLGPGDGPMDPSPYVLYSICIYIY